MKRVWRDQIPKDGERREVQLLDMNAVNSDFDSPCLSLPEAPLVRPFLTSAHYNRTLRLAGLTEGQSGGDNYEDVTEVSADQCDKFSGDRRSLPTSPLLGSSSNVYQGTTAPTTGDSDDDMPPANVMTAEETSPLTHEERGHLHVANQARAFSWILFMAALGVSSLIFFATLAIYLEMTASNIIPTPGQPIPDPSLPTNYDAIALADLPPGQPHAEKLSVTWPLVDLRTQSENQFTDFIEGKKKKSKGVTVGPAIMPIPLLKQANETIVMEGIQAGDAAVNARVQFEEVLLTEGFAAKPGAASSLYCAGQRYSSTETDRRAKAGYSMDRACKFICQSLNLTKEEAEQGIILRDADGIQLNEFCPNTTAGPLSDCDVSNVYRSYDGSCNNIRHSHWGATFEPFRRILNAEYDDGVSQIRMSKNGSTLPNARVVSQMVLRDSPAQPSNASAMLVLWGQFVDHDISSTAPNTGLNGTAIPCCVGGKLIQPEHPECLAILIPPADYLYGLGQYCMNFVRSAAAPVCDFGPREQFNQITSYLDGSTLYGCTTDDAKSIRGGAFGFSPMMNYGRLPTSYIEDGRPLGQRSMDPNDGCNTPEKIEQRQFCFKSGDKRVNEYLGITALNLLWVRQHNLISEQLVTLNPTWSEDKAFEETRRIVIGQIQHITYKEFLPVLLGPDNMAKAKLTPLKTGYYNEYDPTVDPTISNVFATAAFRLGHSMIQGVMKMVGPRWKNEDFVQIHKLFFNPFLMYNMGGMDSVLRGHVSLSTGKPGLHMSNQMSDHLFQLQNWTFGLDMAAMDIQRGRDHGLPPYTAWRAKCGLPAVQNFSQLNNVWTDGAAATVASVYKDVDDVDLYVGGLAELPMPGSMVGPTFACIIVDQFVRLRKGDRFWYENNIQLKPFTPGQLAVIRKTTLARVLCDNGDAIESVPLRPMESESAANPRTVCSSPSIPSLTYDLWEEAKLLPTKIKKLQGKAPEDSLESLFAEDEAEEIAERTKSNSSTSYEITGPGGVTIDFNSPAAGAGRDSKKAPLKTGDGKRIQKAANNGPKEFTSTVLTNAKEGKLLKFRRRRRSE